MFTIKFYTNEGRQIIREAESFTILHGHGGSAEVTLHQKNPAEDCRIDIESADAKRQEDWPPVFQKAIIENSAGKTTEIIAMQGPTRQVAA